MARQEGNTELGNASSTTSYGLNTVTAVFNYQQASGTSARMYRPPDSARIPQARRYNQARTAN
jgi:hypothetical protein